MLRARFPYLFLLTGLLIALTGCGSGGKLGGVTVSAEAVRMAQPATAASTIVVGLKFTNENVVPVGISGGKYKLYLNGTYIAQSVNEMAVGMPQLTSVVKDVTFTLNHASSMDSLRELSRNPQASYRLESVLFIIAGEEKLEIKTQHQGAVDLSGLKLN